MSTKAAPAPYSSVEEAERELDVVADRLRRHDEHGKVLYDQRRAIFRYLLGQGVKQAVIARRAGVSPMAVALAVKDDQAANGKAAKK